MEEDEIDEIMAEVDGEIEEEKQMEEPIILYKEYVWN